MKRFIESYIVAMMMIFLLAICLLPSVAHGEIVEKTHSRLDTGVIFVWKNSAGQWQNNWQPGGRINYSYNHTLPKDSEPVEVHPFSPSASVESPGYFDFDDSKYYHWNPEFACDEGSYLEYYYDYAVTNLIVSGGSSYNPDTGRILVNYGMTLSSQAGAAYNVKAQLAYGDVGKQGIIDLLGNPSQEIIDAMNLMDHSSESYNSNVEGYLYFIPIVFNYTLSEEAEEEEGEEEDEEEPALVVTGEAHLNLPEWTYEGHTVEAWDTSLFTVGGQGYSAYRMYQEGLASDAFFPGGSPTNIRTSLTTADLTFNRIGTFPVRLKVTANTGAVFSDLKNIEVRKTPTLIVDLGGVQKENRKQTLNVVVATAPSFPLETLWIELRRESTGECVHLFHYLDGGQNILANSEGIKTRAIQAVSNGPYFTNVRLDFLTKNTVEETFSYKVYCRDERGHYDEIIRTFVVAPDLPPEGIVSLPEEFLRGKGTNESRIIMEDVSRSDGDQLVRTWTILPLDGDGIAQTPSPQLGNNLAGFMDESFGTEKKISFLKEGVGKVHVHLRVKDHWIEETLEEYILPSDYKEGEALGETEVKNIPPKISIEPLFPKKATVLFIAASKDKAKMLEQNENIFRKLLVQREIDGDIQIERIPPNIADSNIRGYYQGTVVALPFGFNGINTFLENKWFSVDEENLYTINGTWQGGTHSDYPKMPYTITSRQGDTGEVNWTFSITNDVMVINPGQGESFAHDDKGRYLFFRYGGDTLILSKDNGSYLAKIQGVLGDDNYWSSSGGNVIYSFKSDGIYALNTGNGSYRRIYSGQINGKTKALDGGVYFLEQRGPIVINRGFFDLSTEQLSFSRIRGTENDQVNTTYNCLGIDSNGTLIVGVNGDRSVRIYDKSNIFIKSISGWNGDRTFSVTPAYDESGACNYLTASWEGKGGSTYYNYTGVWGVRNNVYIGASTSSENGWRTEAGYPMFALQAGEMVYVQTGAPWDGLWGGGSIMEYTTEYASLCTFGLSTRTWEYSGSGDFAFGVAGEYGSLSDSLLAASYTYNADTFETDPNRSQSGLWAKTKLRYQTLEEVMERILAKSKRDAHVFFVSENPTVSYYEETADLVALGEGKYERVVELKSTAGGSGSLKRAYALDPNKTYYYEYQVKGLSEGAELPIKYDFISSKREPEYQLTPDSYRVTHIETEDFNGVDRNQFFAIPPERVEAGVYKGGDLTKGKTSGTNYVRSDGSSISFTVPDGVKALVSFDYNIRGAGPASSMVLLNGRHWNKIPLVTGLASHYTSPDFLPRGVNTLSFSTVDYGNLPLQSYVHIDNLTVLYVSDTADGAIDSEPIKTEQGDGFLHVKGLVKTPYPIMAYRGFPGEYVYSNFNGCTDPRIVRDNSRPDNKSLSINTPPSQFALDTSILIYSNPTITGGKNSNNVTWTFSPQGYKWTCFGKNLYGSVPLNIPNSWQANLGPIQGSQTINERASAYRGSWGEFYEAGFYQTHRKPPAYNEGSYFYALNSRDGKKTMFLENDVYQGQTLFTIAVDQADDLYFRDFQIYSIENGAKVYVDERVYSPEDFLTKWTSNSVTAESTVIKMPPAKQKETLVYKKGELVSYDLYYSDYEDDPSRREYWRYTHTPFNDGIHPEQGKVLDKSIPRFYIDGKYVVDHWQEDNTRRSELPKDGLGYPLGYPDFNKMSNVETITFYVEGTANAPWITEIRTQVIDDDVWKNKKVDYRDEFRIQIGVDDEEKDILSLTTEVYLDKKLLGVFEEENIKAGREGAYPKIYTSPLPGLAAVGRYQVVCTVRDETGTGLGTYFFQVDRLQPKIRIHRLF